jgi:HlyD family secretion protein
LVLFVAAAVGGIGWGGWKWGWPGSQAGDVLSVSVVRGDLSITVSDRGELESAQSVQVVCEIEGGGRLVTIVTEGKKVRKGDEVARFDTDALMKSIAEQGVKCEQAEGKVKSAESELEVQKNKEEGEVAKADLALKLAEIDLESYEHEDGEYKVELEKRRAALDLGKKELKEAEDNLSFTRGLIKKGLMQREQERALELAVDGKASSVKQQQADLTVLEKFTKKRKLTELAAKAKDAGRDLERTKKSQAAATDKATGEVSAAKKTGELENLFLGRLKAQLEKCVVKAPEDGIVIYSNTQYWNEAARIRPGGQLFFQQPIFTLPDLNNMQVKLKIHESVVKKVIQGQTATMQIEALPNQVLHGKVVSVASVAQAEPWRGNAVKEYDAIVSIDDLPQDAGLRPNMSADVKILIKTLENVLTVPVQAVTEWDGEHVSYVVTGSKIEKRPVKVGESNEQRIQVLEGLSEGERVALDARTRAAGEMKKNKDQDAEKRQPKAGDKRGTPAEPAAVAKS